MFAVDLKDLWCLSWWCKQEVDPPLRWRVLEVAERLEWSLGK